MSAGLVPSKTDVLVIGGGPAGLAAALAARQAGLDVVLADRAQPPIDKACGEGLMPDALAALQRPAWISEAHKVLHSAAYGFWTTNSRPKRRFHLAASAWASAEPNFIGSWLTARSRLASWDYGEGR